MSHNFEPLSKDETEKPKLRRTQRTCGWPIKKEAGVLVAAA
jgi:hypothetical protein